MIKQIKWSTESRKVSELKSYEKNPRKMSAKEKKDIKKSINEFGKVVPLIINIGVRNNIVIGGNQRLIIYQEKKLEKIDVMVPSRELSLKEERELNLRLNRNHAS
jgi:ParB-like chromosome segregation protein Spo0J